ncbi:MAG TPA: hypothetical protein VKU87_09715 [Thermomicrobiaceae bacterium]|nr:hypothetical protein [Thermomicrobiaceae bacterium]
MSDASTEMRIVAASPSKPGDLIVEDREGNRRLFIGSTGSLSRGALNLDFFDALLRRQRWEPIDDDGWYSLEELRAKFTPVEEAKGKHAGRRRLVAAFARSH